MRNMTYYDGFGRPIQEQAFSTEVDINGVISRRTIASTTAYNALGQASCSTTPYDIADAQATWPSNNYQTAPCTSKDHTLMTNDALGRPSSIIAPDGSQTTTLYGLNSTYSHNAENQLQAAFTDNFGRLTAVDETLATFTDEFDDAGLPGWSKNGDVTVVNGELQIAGDGSWTNSATHTMGTTGDRGTAFSFYVDDINNNTKVNIHLSTGAQSQPGYRRWGIDIDGGQIRLIQYEDAAYTSEAVMAFEEKTWYRAVLRSSQSSAYYVFLVWEEGNPDNSAEIRIDHGAWGTLSWKFQAFVRTNNAVLHMDDFQELEFNRTRISV